MEQFKTRFQVLTEKSAAILSNSQRNQTSTERKANKACTKLWATQWSMADQPKSEKGST